MKKYLIITSILYLSIGLLSICLSQSSGKIIYTTILESEDYQELESVLFFKGDESMFFVRNHEAYIASLNESKSDYNSGNEFGYITSFNMKPPKDSLIHQVYIDRYQEVIKSKRSIFKGGIYYPCVVLESKNLFKWDLINESKKIGTHTAYQAKSTFRGRNYTAWFAPEIEVDAGPWKFNGLPGLILEIVDDEKGVQFLFSSWEIPYEDTLIIKPPEEELVLTVEEYAVFNDPERISQEFINWLSLELPAGANVINPASISTTVNITGIEREYE